MNPFPNIGAGEGDEVLAGVLNHRRAFRTHTPATIYFAMEVLLFLSSGAGFRDYAANPAGSVNPIVDANQLVREAIHNELQAQVSDQAHWRYRERQEKNGSKELRDVIETKDGQIDRLLAVNDEPLTPKQDQMEDSRVQKLLVHPGDIRKEQQKRDEDNEKESQLFQSFPRAFSFQYAGMDGGLIRFKFTPNPHFHASNREEQVFHHMQGTMWIDLHQKRLAGIDGHLTSRVGFGGGLLGHLDKGGTFSVRLKDVDSGHWVLDSLDVQMKGKALFFKTISVQQNEQYTNYQPIPDDMTLRRAAQILQEDSSALRQTVTSRSSRN